MDIHINDKKMWESIFKYCPKEHLYGKVLNAALADQGLRWNGKEIVSIDPEPKEKVPEGWYICKKNFSDDKLNGILPVFCKGECTPKEKVFATIPYMTEELFAEYFEPAKQEEMTHSDPPILRSEFMSIVNKLVELQYKNPTEKKLKEEIHSWFEEPKQDYQWSGKIGKKEPTGVLREMLDNLHEYKLAKTKEEMMKESSDGELSEFEKVIEELVFKIDGDYAVFMQSAEPYIKEFEPKLIEAARKMLQPEIDAEIEKAYKNQDDVVYQRGYITGLEAHRDDLTKEILSRVDVDEMVENLSSFRFGTDTTIIEIYKSAIIDTIKAIKGE